MRVAEIILEMAFLKRVAEAKIRNNEQTINLHLVKLLAFAVEPGTLQFWRKEILAVTGFIATIQMRVGNGVRKITPAEYYNLLYTEPFEHNEIAYTQALIRIAFLKSEQEGRPLQRNTRSVEDIAQMIEKFHNSLSSELGKGQDGADLLAGLPPQDVEPELPAYGSTRRRRRKSRR
jgi:hypothetical protein